MRQYIRSACFHVSLLHSVLNGVPAVQLADFIVAGRLSATLDKVADVVQARCIIVAMFIQQLWQVTPCCCLCSPI